MSDDAELYMEMQDPYFWDWVEEYNHHSYDDDDYYGDDDVEHK